MRMLACIIQTAGREGLWRVLNGDNPGFFESFSQPNQNMPEPDRARHLATGDDLRTRMKALPQSMRVTSSPSDTTCASAWSSHSTCAAAA